MQNKGVHNDMKVYGFKEKVHGIMEIGDDLQSYRNFVGGSLEVYCIGNSLDIVLNQEGRLKGLELRVEYIEGDRIIQVIAGDCFVCRHDEYGKFISINDEDIPYIKEKLKPVVMQGKVSYL